MKLVGVKYAVGSRPSSVKTTKSEINYLAFN